MPLKPAAAYRKDKCSAIGEMQHRHFATVATIINRLHLSGTMSQADAACVAEHFASELIWTNPKFDKKRFLAACGCEPLAF